MYKSRKTLRFKPLASRRGLAEARTSLGLPPRHRGAQPGNSNRLIHGRYARPFIARRAHIRGILSEARTVIAELTLARRAVAVAWRLLALGRSPVLSGSETAAGFFDTTHGSSSTLAEIT